jgi:hypothetical protein
VDDDEVIREAIRRARETGVPLSDEFIADQVREMRALHEIGLPAWQLEAEERERRGSPQVSQRQSFTPAQPG